MRIAFAGNPNSGKTTMYNALTGRNERVGNWAGVTVERKESLIKKSYYDGAENWWRWICPAPIPCRLLLLRRASGCDYQYCGCHEFKQEPVLHHAASGAGRARGCCLK